MATRFFRCLAFALAIALLPGAVSAAEIEKKTEAKNVELFAAMKAEQIAVKYIPKDETQARLIIENKTDQPLNIELPEVFAGVPVLAQFGTQGGQGTGGGFGGGGAGGGAGGAGGGAGGGFFSVPAEKVMDIKVATLCLEHGKPDPRPQAAYEIRPIESFTTNKAVQELCRVFGAKQLPRDAAQAAAWHLANNMSWEELANKRIKRANGTSYPYFSQQALQIAYKVSLHCEQVAKKASESEDPGKATSESQN